MGCCKILIFLSISIYASVHVQASRPSTTGSSFRAMSSQPGGLTDSKSARKILLEENKPRAWWQISQKLLARQMGSKPPNCEDKCHYCNPCEAVEVPISNREVQKVKALETDAAAGTSHQKVSTALADPHDTNYMPESWRCACGDEYFNP
ncbi:hypothetical protein Mapa_015719 [Marchantia paleacea]|nr:hypothetical protein Mapa_015719 [Marchantia paleacea]